MSYRNDDNFDPTGCLLILIMVIIFATYFGIEIKTSIDENRVTSSFDRAYKEGNVVFEENLIPLGSEGHPANSVFPEYIPTGGSQLMESPRLYKVSNCEGLTMPENADGVFASTNYFQVNQVEITVPQRTTGYVNVCVPEGTRIDVVLWAKE
jgi:hypothetical protein